MARDDWAEAARPAYDNGYEDGVADGKGRAVSKLDHARAQFLNKHQYVITTALNVYVSHMRENALETARQLEKLDTPEKRAAQDQSLVTTDGLRHMIAAFSQAAHSAEAALEALEDLDAGRQR